MLNSNKLFIFRSSEVKQKGGVRDMDLHKTLGVPHLSIGVDYFLIGAESFMTSVTQRPITIRHVATAKTQNSTIFYTKFNNFLFNNSVKKYNAYSKDFTHLCMSTC